MAFVTDLRDGQDFILREEGWKGIPGGREGTCKGPGEERIRHVLGYEHLCWSSFDVGNSLSPGRRAVNLPPPLPQ